MTAFLTALYVVNRKIYDESDIILIAPHERASISKSAKPPADRSASISPAVLREVKCSLELVLPRSSTKSNAHAITRNSDLLSPTIRDSILDCTRHTLRSSSVASYTTRATLHNLHQRASKPAEPDRNGCASISSAYVHRPRWSTKSDAHAITYYTCACVPSTP